MDTAQSHQHDTPVRVRLWLLGGFRAERDGVPVPESAWERPTARILVKLLAQHPTHQLHREQVMEALWPELSPESAAQSLRNALSRARKALEPEARRGDYRLLRLRGELLDLNPELVWVDVDDFVQLAVEALTSGAFDELDRAVRAYGGELLPEDRFADWAVARREELAGVFVRVAMRLIDSLEAGGQYGEAIARAEELLRQDSSQEELHRRLMRLHLLTGSRHRALQQYQTCRAVLERELGVEPDEETEALHAQILALGSSAPSVSSVFPLPPAVVRAIDTPLVGRGTARDLLWRSVEGAQRGAGDVVLISGEPGVGKTRLVAEIGRQAAAAGMRVLWGASHGTEGGLPYAPFIEALEGVIGSLPGGRRGDLSERYPEIAPIVPSLESRGPGVSAAGGDTPQFFASVVRLLTELAAEQPLLLILDDLHAADAASVQLLDHLMRVASRQSWLILGTFRMEDVEATTPFAGLWTAAVRAGRSRRVGLMRLSEAEAAELVASLLQGPVDAHLERHIAERSLGNPLFVSELVRTWQESGKIFLREGRWVFAGGEEVVVPHGVRDLIRQRVARLDAVTRQVLQIAAVAGGEVAFGTLLGAYGLAEGPLLDALDEALEGRLLTEVGEGYTFVHPLFQEALYASLSTGRRMQLHGRLATVLEERAPVEVEALAYHHARAGNDEQALVYLERAGDRASSVYANDTAARRYGELIDHLGAHARHGDAARVRCKLAAVLAVMGRYAAALDVLEAALAHYRETENAAGLAHGLGRAGRIHWLRGSHAAGLAQIESLLPWLENQPASPEMGDLWIALAHLYFAAGRMQESLEAAERAGALARATGNNRLLAEAESRRAKDLWMLTADPARPDHEQNRTRYRITPEEILRMLEDTSALAEKSGDLPTAASTLQGLGVFAGDLGDFARTERALTRLLDLDERTGNTSRMAHDMVELAALPLRRGEWARARALLERAAELVQGLEADWQSAYPFIELARLDFLEGNREGMEAHLVEAATRAERDDNRHARHLVVQLQAERDLENGRPAEARSRLERVIRPRSDCEVPELMDTLALTYAETGDVARAEKLMEFAVTAWEAQGLRRDLLDHLVVQGQVLLQADKRDEALQALDQAETLALEMSVPYLRAQALYLRSLVLEGRERRTALEEALAIFERLGARPAAERTRTALTHHSALY